MADALSAARVALAVAILWSGARGLGSLAFGLLVAAAITDVLDGPIARRRGGTKLGPTLDAFADTTVLASTAATLVVLHPAIAAGAGPALLAVTTLYAAGTVATWLARRRLVDPGQLTAKVAGGALYTFALFTLATGDYEPGLLAIAAIALAVSSAEAIVRATVTIQQTWRASRHRSHAPQAVNGVTRSTAAEASMASSANPSANEMRP